MKHIELELVTLAHKETLRNVMALYLYEFSQYGGEDVDEDGRFPYRYFDLYWTEAGRFPYLIQVNDQIAGLVLVRTLDDGDDPLFHLAEFFVMAKYRRQGVGREAAFRLFDRYQGRWEVQQEAANLPAQTFWRAIIGAYTDGRYHEEWRITEDHVGPVQRFHSRSGTLT